MGHASTLWGIVLPMVAFVKTVLQLGIDINGGATGGKGGLARHFGHDHEWLTTLGMAHLSCGCRHFSLQAEAIAALHILFVTDQIDQ